MMRNVVLLATCQALMMTGMSLIGTISALVGYALAEDKALATLPHGLQFVGMMLVTFPASLLMGRIGRRLGFMLGVTLAALGASMAALAILEHHFALFCAASFVIGWSTAFGQYYRFAAADVASVEYRSRAISLVLSGGVVAALAGPNLARATQDLLAAPFAGGYAAIVMLNAASFLVLAFVRMPRPRPATVQGGGRPLAVIIRQPAYITALACAVIAYTTMALVMTATPLAMQARGLPFGDTVLVIQWHILGMYGPAFVTGHLIRSLGVLNVMLVGALLAAACAVINLLGETTAHIWSALFLMGIGWNFLFTGATTLLTETYREEEKARAQGFNDLVLFSGVAASALLSGAIHHALGWFVLNAAVVVPAALAVGLLVWMRVSAARPRPVGV